MPACRLVKYCNRDCQIAHRPLHKKICKKRVTELHDEALFKEPPPPEECPICFLPLPLDAWETMFKSCCGKLICCGCILAIHEEELGRGKIDDICAFCRTPVPISYEEEVKRLKKLIAGDKALGYHRLAGLYFTGSMGLPLDMVKANELWLKAGELGCAGGYNNLGNSYNLGSGVEVDKKKAKHFYELAAMSGDVDARHNFACFEGQAGNSHRAYKHYIIAAKAGYKLSLDAVKNGFMGGIISKDEYANTLRAYQRAHDETKSDMRDKARATMNDGFTKS